jgi:DNA transformation protein and related proteins
MAVSDGYLAFVIDQLGQITPVRSRRMFGGVGLYSEDAFFGLIANDTLFFLTDDSSRANYVAINAERFGNHYFAVPADALEDIDQLRLAADKAINAAHGRNARKAA